MCCVGKWFAAVALATAAGVVGFNLYTSVDAAQPPKADAKDAAKPVDLSGLRDAVGAASKRGENVGEIRAALDAVAKVAPAARPGVVPPELQKLRDAVDMAASKGENVDAIARELSAVEVAVAGKSLAKPKPEPKPEPRPEPNPFPGLPGVPFRPLPPVGGFGGVGGGIDVQAFNKAMELRREAIDLMVKNPRDPEARKKLQEANDAMLRAVRGGAGGGMVPPAPLFGELGRVPDRARLGIRMERVPAVAADQLGLEPDAGVVVSTVMPDSPAEKAGLKVHDIIVEFAGKPVDGDLEDFVRQVGAVKAGEKVNLVVLRKGKKVELKGVELPEAKAIRAPQPIRPNLRLDPVLPINPALPLNPAAGRAGAGLPAGFGTVSYANSDGSFTLKASKGETRFTLSGTVDEDGRPTVTKATVEDGGKTHAADSVSKLPEAFRADAAQLLKTIEPRR
jgi:hypothetical protein